MKALPLLTTLFILMLLITPPAFAFDLPALQDDREFFVDETLLPFESIPGTQTQTLWGVLNGAGYRVEVPENWKGDLVMWAHGFRGTGAELTVDDHPLRAFLIANGYAWAASSYSKNFYDVRSGVESTNELVRYFQKTIGKPDRIFMTGASMGGHVTGVAIEQFPNFKCPDGRRGRLCERISNLLGRISGGVKYDGAVPICGVMGDRELFNYFVDFRLVSEQLAGLPNQFPTSEDYITSTLPIVISQLFANSGLGFPNELGPQGEILKNFVRETSGGDRPVFDVAFPFFQELLFGTGIGDGTADGVIGANLYDNQGTTYQLDADTSFTEEERALNDSISRISRNPNADPARFLRLQRLPEISGRLSVPVVTLHTLGDLFVPFSMEQTYARNVAKQGRSEFLVQRAIRDIGHCAFDPIETIEAFSDMVTWVDTGVKPDGDDILNPEVVADPNFGCEFTRSNRSQPLVTACTTP